MTDSMIQLARQKQVLVARSDAYRSQLALEMANVQAAAMWIPRTVHTVRTISPFLAWLVPVAGFLIGRRLRAKERPRRSNWLGRILTALQLYRKARTVISTLSHYLQPPRAE